MLKNAKFVLLCLILAGCSQNNKWILCAANGDRPPLVIDFDSELATSSDTTFEMGACGKDIRQCFYGPFNFVDPNAQNHLEPDEIPFKYSIAGKPGMFDVRTDGKFSVARYKYSKYIINLEIVEKSTGIKASYERC